MARWQSNVKIVTAEADRDSFIVEARINSAGSHDESGITRRENTGCRNKHMAEKSFASKLAEVERVKVGVDRPMHV